MTDSLSAAASIERRSLEIGKWGNLVMAVVGVGAAYLSRSDALLIDGLYSGVNFVSAIIAAQVSVAVAKRPDRRFPFGYAIYEALYVNFRSLVLLGIMGVAVFGAAQKIYIYASGGAVPELVYGPIVIYTIAMVTMCAALAFWHYYNWQRSGKQSELLTTESKAAIVDGAISGGAGGGLLAATLLAGTALAVVIPVADSVIVLVMTVCIVGQPIAMFTSSLREIAGAAKDSGKEIHDVLVKLAEENDFELIETVTTKLGRTHFIVAYMKPLHPVAGNRVDQVTALLEEQCSPFLGSVLGAVVVTDLSPFDS